MDDQAIVVTGMHRSGTSLVASILLSLSIDMGEELLAPDSNNPRGYFEDVEFLELQQQMLQACCCPGEAGHPDWGWTESERLETARTRQFASRARSLVAARARKKHLWGWKDPRTTLLLEFWDTLLRDPRYVLVYRFPWDVADSMQRLGAAVFLANPEYAYRIWRFYNRHLRDFYVRNSNRCVLVSINALRRNPNRLVELLCSKLGLELSGSEAKHRYESELFNSIEGCDPLIDLIAATSPECIQLLRDLDSLADLSSTGLWEASQTQTRSSGTEPPNQQHVDLSVVIPCHDQGQFLIEAVASVERSAVSRCEIIIVNDGSKQQRTLEIIEILKTLGYFVIDQPNRGLSAARNRGISVAAGRYVLPLDADNRVRCGFPDEAVAILDSKPEIGVVYGRRYDFGLRRGVVTVPDFDLDRLLCGNYIDACAVFRKQVWVDCDGYDAAASPLEDWELWINASKRGWRFHSLTHVTFDYRVRPDSLLRLFERPEVSERLLKHIASKHHELYRMRLAFLRAEIESKEELVREARCDLAIRERKEVDLAARIAEKDELVETLTSSLHNAQARTRTISSELTRARQQADALSIQLEQKEDAVNWLISEVSQRDVELLRIKRSLGWRLLSLYGPIKYRIVLPFLRWFAATRERHSIPQSADSERVLYSAPSEGQRVYSVQELVTRPVIAPHNAYVDVIICVHNALDDTQRCLESVIRCTGEPYSLMLVDDGSNEETHKYLAEFASVHEATLIRNEQARGYTFAANQGLRQSKGDYVVLLNSDTVVAPDWLDRMIACGESDRSIGLVGPLSNSATWQSIPEIVSDGQFAENKLPEGWTVADMGRAVAEYSARLYPRIPFLNGFCMMIKRQVIEQIGDFDEEAFGRGYGEENDYCLRARKAGWQAAVAEDAYVYHAQSRSYSHERRVELWKHAGKTLTEKHGQQIIDEGVSACRYGPVLEGIRARSRVMAMRERLIEQGKALWEGKQVLFILPISGVGGGGNVVLDEAEAMRKMGLGVSILNLKRFQEGFEREYPDNTLPVIFVSNETEISELLSNYDAVVATWCASVDWLALPDSSKHVPVRGYYIQDFEPYFFDEKSAEFRVAWESYTRYPDLVRVTKTEWNRAIVKEQIGVECTVVGPSVNIDLYRPRRPQNTEWAEKPLRIAAMIRPSSLRRAPEFTLETLADFYRAHRDVTEIILFGCDSGDLRTLGVPDDFSYRNAGVVTRPQIASLFNEIDIFADFSSFQAMGLTAMEAMCCGAAVIVPQRGGASSFVEHEENGIIVDTDSREACLLALERLVADGELRNRLRRQAILDICQFFPEGAAYNILSAMFQEHRYE